MSIIPNRTTSEFSACVLIAVCASSELMIALSSSVPMSDVVGGHDLRDSGGKGGGGPPCWTAAAGHGDWNPRLRSPSASVIARKTWE
jgi:hypothetical protein